MNVAKTVNIFKAVKKGQENEKTAKTAKRQGKTIKVKKEVRSISDTFLFASHLWIGT